MRSAVLACVAVLLASSAGAEEEVTSPRICAAILPIMVSLESAMRPLALTPELAREVLARPELRGAEKAAIDKILSTNERLAPLMALLRAEAADAALVFRECAIRGG